MAKHRKRDVPFADSLTPSEGRFWRDIIEGKTSVLRNVGISAVLGMVGVAVVIESFDLFPGTSYSVWERLLNAAILWSVATLVVGGMLAFAHWNIRKRG